MLTSIYRGGAGSGDGNNNGAPSEEPNDGERASTRAMAKERLNSICSICWCDACIQCENCLCDLYGSNLQHNHVSQPLASMANQLVTVSGVFLQVSFLFTNYMKEKPLFQRQAFISINISHVEML